MAERALPSVCWLRLLGHGYDGAAVFVVASFYPGQRRKMATVAAFSTTATNLFLNLVLVKARCLNEQHVIVGEVLALVLEAAAYAFMSRPRDVPRGVFVSALANALSFAAGFSPHLARLFD